MEIHPSQIPITQLFDIKDYSDVSKVINKMLELGFSKEVGFKILMPKDQNLARKLGYTILNELNKGLRMQQYEHNIRYFVYHQDSDHYAVVIASEEAIAKLNL